MPLFGYKYFPFAFIIILMALSKNEAHAQSCSTNIDFELGNFQNWICLTGFVQASGGDNIISLSSSGQAINDRHTIIPRATSIGQTDFYGGFPVNCPNGSAFSVRLGNTSGGHQAEGIAYEFAIPANRNTYSLIYNYAVVFQNPNHQIQEQPRLEIEVTNVTDGNKIDCSSFTFIPFGSSLPGFYNSPVADSVLCKDWSPVTINLNGNAGKTIRVTFKTADCVFNRHFGYAYIDVNTECSGEFSGAAYCPDDTVVNVIAPYGFAQYEWYNVNFTSLLGTSQVLTLQPPPPSGSILAVKLIPFSGFGCVDTMYAIMEDTLRLRANAGSNQLLCGAESGILLGEPPKLNVIYNWSPNTGLSDSTVSNPLASPAITTQYILNIRNAGGGCRSADTVTVIKSLVDTTLRFLGKNEFCITSQDSAVLLVNPQRNVQWFKNNQPINGANLFKYRAQQSGEYYAKLTGIDGCISNTRNEIVSIEKPAPGITYPIVFALVNDPVELEARNFNGTTQWQPALYLDNAFTLKPIFTSPIVTEQQYKINIISKAGCATTDFQTVKVLKEVAVFVPNAFTPNNDNKNDYFTPLSLGATIVNFKIYNRLGEQVFSMEQNERGWDGKYKGIAQLPATYVWILQAMGIDKKTVVKKGTVILIR